MEQQTRGQERLLFVEDDITCPLCESYKVIEEEITFVCSDCGTSWKTLTTEK